MTSLDQSEVTIGQYKKQGLKPGQKIVDASQAQNQKFKLVMVGRKVSQEEIDQNALMDFDEKQGHMLSSEIYHESSETFSESIKADEGLFKHYARNFYWVLAFFAAANLSFKAYVLAFDAAMHAEDYQDELIFQYVKRQRNQGLSSIKNYSTPENEAYPGQFWEKMKPVKAGPHPSVQFLLNNVYRMDLYSVEGRTN